MSDDLGVEAGELDVYPHKIITKTVGKVDADLVNEATGTVKDVFIRLGYNGEPPEFVSISQGVVLLPSGEEVEACYGYDAPKTPGRIYVSSEKSKASFKDSGIPIEVATAAFAAHEAVEHVNHMKGKELLSSHRKLKPEEHKSETEDEANSIAREIIEKRYRWTVRFGDENV